MKNGHISIIFTMLITVTTGAYSGISEGKKLLEEGNNKAALNEFKPLADAGNSDAQYYTSKASEDWEEGTKYLRKSADQGHLKAQYELGIRYCRGFGVPKIRSEGLKWLEASAKAGNIEAALELAWAHHDYFKSGCSPYFRTEQKSPYDARKWFKFAAELGSLEGMTFYGKMLSFGEGGYENKTEAIKWLIKPAEEGGSYAQFYLGSILLDKSKTPAEEKNAADWLTKSANNGNAFAQYELFNLYSIGRGVEYDKDKSIKWLIKSTEEKEDGTVAAEGVVALAKLYLAGEKIKIDEKKLFASVSKTAGQYDGDLVLAEMHFRGIGTKVDNMKGLSQVATRLVNKESKMFLVKMYENGWGVKKSISAAIGLCYYIIETEGGNNEDVKNVQLALWHKTPEPAKSKINSDAIDLLFDMKHNLREDLKFTYQIQDFIDHAIGKMSRKVPPLRSKRKG